MKRFIEGASREQATLFPDRLDDYICEDNPVRVVDVFVDELDLQGLGFGGAVPEATGRPGYHPATLLKIYIYGYLNRLQSSRRLERECGRNVELMWLTGRLAPDFKTISDFRRDNGKAIRAACKTFITLCRQLDLFADAFVAIDGSKFRAVNNRDKNYTHGKIERRRGQIEQSIERYLAELDTADRQVAFDPVRATAKVERLGGKLAKLRVRMERLNEVASALLQTPDQQISLTDPDARSMATSGRGSGIVGYNVQAAVDTTHHLIVTHEVTNVGHDRTALSPTALQARAVIGSDTLKVVADRGYFSGEQFKACADEGITIYVPKPLTSSGIKRGLFGKQDFIFDADKDHYLCPAGQTLTRGRHRADHNSEVNFYRHLSACFTCELKPRCTAEKLRRIRRWDHEDILDDAQHRLDQAPDMMRIRRETVEHPFGTIKAWMGATHFQTKTLEKVKTEMGLHVLAYNLKRVMNIIGIIPLMAAMRAA